MTTPTLDQAKIIVYSSTSSASAVAALKNAGFDVWQSSLDSRHYGVHFDSGSVGFCDCSVDGDFCVFIDSKLVKPEQRKAFLESQKQVSEAPYIEARQLAKQYRSDHSELSGGAVIVFNGQVAGWVKSLFDTASSWEPNCIAVDEIQICWLASGGNAYDGSKMWVPTSYLFSEPQQQPTDTVPAVSTAVEAHPLAPFIAVPLIEDDSPTFKFLVSIMPITDLGGVFQDSDYEHAVYNRLLAQASYLSQQIGRPATVYDLSLACVLSAIKAVSDEIENYPQLSTESVDKVGE